MTHNRDKTLLIQLKLVILDSLISDKLIMTSEGIKYLGLDIILEIRRARRMTEKKTYYHARQMQRQFLDSEWSAPQGRVYMDNVRTKDGTSGRRMVPGVIG